MQESKTIIVPGDQAIRIRIERVGPDLAISVGPMPEESANTSTIELRNGVVLSILWEANAEDYEWVLKLDFDILH